MTPVVLHLVALVAAVLSLACLVTMRAHPCEVVVGGVMVTAMLDMATGLALLPESRWALVLIGGSVAGYVVMRAARDGRATHSAIGACLMGLALVLMPAGHHPGAPGMGVTSGHAAHHADTGSSMPLVYGVLIAVGAIAYTHAVVRAWSRRPSAPLARLETAFMSASLCLMFAAAIS